MGRNRRRVYHFADGPIRAKDKGRPGNTPQQLIMFARESSGPVSEALWQQKLIGFDAEGEVTVKPENVQKAAKDFSKAAVSQREYPEQQALQDAQIYGGLTPRKAINQDNREMKAKAEALLAAAKAANVKIEPSDKRAINAAARGKWWDYVYGERNERGQRQYERGTLISRMDSRRSSSRWDDGGYRARAEEKARELREYRYGDDARRNSEQYYQRESSYSPALVF